MSPFRDILILLEFELSMLSPYLDAVSFVFVLHFRSIFRYAHFHRLIDQVSISLLFPILFPISIFPSISSIRNSSNNCSRGISRCSIMDLFRISSGYPSDIYCGISLRTGPELFLQLLKGLLQTAFF